MTIPTDLLSGIAICVGAAALLALIGWRLHQPLILAYLLAGVVIGPVGLKWVTDLTSIQTVAEIGLILLLFVIGLEIDLKKLASAGLGDTDDRARVPPRAARDPRERVGVDADVLPRFTDELAPVQRRLGFGATEQLVRDIDRRSHGLHLSILRL